MLVKPLWLDGYFFENTLYEGSIHIFRKNSIIVSMRKMRIRKIRKRIVLLWIVALLFVTSIGASFYFFHVAQVREEKSFINHKARSKDNALYGYSKTYRIEDDAVTFSSIGTLGHPEVRKVLSSMATGTSGSMYNISMEKLKAFL